MFMSSDDSKTLKLVKKSLNLSDLKYRNYWNTAGLNKEYFPSEPRQESIPTFNKQGRVIHEPKDPWWINSEDHHFCFWTYIRDKSQSDGTMEPLLQSEIASLFGCSSTKVHFMLKEAMEKLMSDDNMKILQNLFELTKEEPFEETIPFSSISNIDSLEDGQDTE